MTPSTRYLMIVLGASTVLAQFNHLPKRQEVTRVEDVKPVTAINDAGEGFGQTLTNLGSETLTTTNAAEPTDSASEDNEDLPGASGTDSDDDLLAPLPNDGDESASEVSTTTGVDATGTESGSTQETTDVSTGQETSQTSITETGLLATDSATATQGDATGASEQSLIKTPAQSSFGSTAPDDTAFPIATPSSGKGATDGLVNNPALGESAATPATTPGAAVTASDSPAMPTTPFGNGNGTDSNPTRLPSGVAGVGATGIKSPSSLGPVESGITAAPSNSTLGNGSSGDGKGGGSDGSDEDDDDEGSGNGSENGSGSNGGKGSDEALSSGSGSSSAATTLASVTASSAALAGTQDPEAASQTSGSAASETTPSSASGSKPGLVLAVVAFAVTAFLI